MTTTFTRDAAATGEEIDFIVDKMPSIIERLRQMSPFWKQAVEEGTAPSMP